MRKDKAVKVCIGILFGLILEGCSTFNHIPEGREYTKDTLVLLNWNDSKWFQIRAISMDNERLDLEKYLSLRTEEAPAKNEFEKKRFKKNNKNKIKKGIIKTAERIESAIHIVRMKATFSEYDFENNAYHVERVSPHQGGDWRSWCCFSLDHPDKARPFVPKRERLYGKSIELYTGESFRSIWKHPHMEGFLKVGSAGDVLMANEITNSKGYASSFNMKPNDASIVMGETEAEKVHDAYQGAVDVYFVAEPFNLTFGQGDKLIMEHNVACLVVDEGSTYRMVVNDYAFSDKERNKRTCGLAVNSSQFPSKTLTAKEVVESMERNALNKHN